MNPNIILINCDDLGYGDLGCYGSTVNKTPHIDRLAAEGVRCTSFYMASPVSSPSRGAMLTGCYPTRIGFGAFDNNTWVLFPGQPTGLNPSEMTIAKMLKTRGYATRIVGKWHCGDQPEHMPTKHGFDGYFGIPYSNDMGRQNKDDKYPPLPLMLDETVIQQQPDQAALTERYLDDSVRFVRANRDKPFFLYFAHMYVHLPIYASQRFMATSENGAYGAGVSCVDWTVGVLMAELKALGLDENTIIIFTSDNGSRGDHGGSNAPLRGKKGTTWDGGQRVPCIVRWPAALKGGQTRDQLSTSMDFLPTFAAITGAELPSDRIIDGKNVLPVWEQGVPSPRKAFFYFMRNQIEAVRAGKWKLHVYKWDKEVLELYDLDADIAETTNVAERHPEVVKELQGYLDEMRADLGDSRLGIKPTNARAPGRAANPKMLTTFDPEYPYFMAEYDLQDRG